MPKRKPLDYTAQFVPGVFRPQAEVDDEREALAAAEAADAHPPVRRQAHRADTLRASGGPANERSNERTAPRVTIRHSFDIWQDQLHALAGIQAQEFAATGKKPKMGDFIKEALDAYIRTKQRGFDRTNGRTNERTVKE